MGFRNITVLLLLLPLSAGASASESTLTDAARELIQRVISKQANGAALGGKMFWFLLRSALASFLP